MSSFPKDFLFSTSTASYQVEGAWSEDGKGENIWDRLVHTKPEAIHNKDNGDVACDSYHKYKEDIALVKEIGFQVYRFSISWSRILPNGEITNINEAGINFYHNLIDEVLSNGIQPMVTMYHWDLPQRLQDMGGWINPLMADYFEDYANVLFERFGDKVQWWITINEPSEIIDGYCEVGYAPMLDLASNSDYLVAHTLIRAHAKAYRLYDRCHRSKQKGKITITLSERAFFPKTESQEDKDAVDRAYLYTLSWLAHPIYSEEGDYPKLLKDNVDENSKKEGRTRSRLPKFTTEEVEQIKGTWDFFALNFYSSSLCTSGVLPYYIPKMRDANVIYSYDPSWPSSKATWLKVTPQGFTEILCAIKNRYNNPPVFVTENGYCDNGEMDDQGRITYYKVYLEALLSAINEKGCNVIGYTAWSILDNFEWRDGYENRFGLIKVDFTDPSRKRTPKSSAEFFKKLIKNRKIPDEDVQVVECCYKNNNK